jgi:hypothetical protein
MGKYDRVGWFDLGVKENIRISRENFERNLIKTIDDSSFRFMLDGATIHNIAMEAFDTDPFNEYYIKFTGDTLKFVNILFPIGCFMDKREYFGAVAVENGRYMLWIYVPNLNLELKEIAIICTNIQTLLNSHGEPDYDYSSFIFEIFELLKWSSVDSLGEKLYYEVKFSEEDFFRGICGEVLYEIYTGNNILLCLYQIAGQKPMIRIYIPIKNCCQRATIHYCGYNQYSLA